MFLHKTFTNPSLSCNFCYIVIMVSVANKKWEGGISGAIGRELSFMYGISAYLLIEYSDTYMKIYLQTTCNTNDCTQTQR